VAAASATIAQWLFGIFLVLFLGALFIGLTIGAWSVRQKVRVKNK
jgi:uncharacterized membrane protein YtjA (UPF0391 family)